MTAIKTKAYEPGRSFHIAFEGHEWRPLGIILLMRKLIAGLLLLPILAACGGTPADGNILLQTPVPASLEPYQTATLAATATIIPPLTTLTLPTTTPILYTIAKGDTLSAIAGRYNVTVDALLAANPTIQAGALVVGKTLVIPTGARATGEPVPTPASVPVSQVRCWSEAGGGLWCLALLQNQYAETLENLSVQFTLLNPDGQELAAQPAYGLLDILPAGQSMPMAAYFPPPISGEARARVQVITAVRLLPGDKRYLPAAVENTLVSLEASGRKAQVSGQVRLTGGTAANTTWILATAFDANGTVVGLRRWESTAELREAEPLQFDFQVSSVGPQIQRVDFLVEARP